MSETQSSTVPVPASSSSTATTIANIGQHVGETVTLRGWLYNLRSSGKLLFPTFRDGTGTIQGIVPKAAVPEAVFDDAEGADAGELVDGDRDGAGG